jgi:hypothetical protein
MDIYNFLGKSSPGTRYFWKRAHNIEKAVRRENPAVVIFVKAGIMFFKEEESK